jgi:hypothetical protein
MMATDMTVSGTPEEKLAWAFKVKSLGISGVIFSSLVVSKSLLVFGEGSECTISKLRKPFLITQSKRFRI